MMRSSTGHPAGFPMSAARSSRRSTRAVRAPCRERPPRSRQPPRRRDPAGDAPRHRHRRAGYAARRNRRAAVDLPMPMPPVRPMTFKTCEFPCGNSIGGVSKSAATKSMQRVIDDRRDTEPLHEAGNGLMEKHAEAGGGLQAARDRRRDKRRFQRRIDDVGNRGRTWRHGRGRVSAGHARPCRARSY